jgi:hypothetical protein
LIVNSAWRERRPNAVAAPKIVQRRVKITLLKTVVLEKITVLG